MDFSKMTLSELMDFIELSPIIEHRRMAIAELRKRVSQLD